MDSGPQSTSNNILHTAQSTLRDFKNDAIIHLFDFKFSLIDLSDYSQAAFDGSIGDPQFPSDVTLDRKDSWRKGLARGIHGITGNEVRVWAFAKEPLIKAHKKERHSQNQEKISGVSGYRGE